MTGSLVRKLLRDVRLALVITALLLAAFQCLWAKITERITGQLLPFFTAQMGGGFLGLIFQGPGKIIQTLIGGDSINLSRAMDMMTIGYVHPLVQTILCIWAVGRAAGAIAGEIDRGTMELLLAQPLARHRLVLAHLGMDLITIPVLCLSLWAGTWLGTWLIDPIQVSGRVDPELLRLDPGAFGPALANVAALLFAISGYTMWLSAAGRSFGRVLAWSVLLTLLQFLVNVVGQLWDVLAPLRPFTVFYYYQPQQIILRQEWAVALDRVWSLAPSGAALNVLAVLVAVGTMGYGMALGIFCRRDLPAPL